MHEEEESAVLIQYNEPIFWESVLTKFVCRTLWAQLNDELHEILR